MDLERYLPVDLAIGQYEITLEALEQVALSQFSAGTLRGAFSLSFKRMVCYQPHVKTCQGCMLRGQCPYPQVFEPVAAPGTRQAGQRSVPAPYVLRPPAGDRRVFQPGEQIAFQLVLVGRSIGLLPYFVVALQQLERSGLGRGRSRVRLVRVEAVGPGGATSGLFDIGAPEVIRNHGGWPAGDWIGRDPAPPQVMVEFVSPVRLRIRDSLQWVPDFAVLFRALMRRASALSVHHDDQQWQTDFAALAREAETVRLLSSYVSSSSRKRYSGRQEREVELIGSRGWVAYAGNLQPFWPLLQLGQVIHVGKSTTFGLGRYRLRPGAAT